MHDADDWTAVPGFEGFYEASLELMAVRGVDRVIVDGRGQRRRIRGKRMWPTSAGGHLMLSRDGHGFSTDVASIVARTFAPVSISA